MKLRTLATALLALTVVTTPGAAFGATDPDDPAAGQIVDESQGIATDEVVISEGHVDLGPHYVDGDWTLMAHDDTAEPSTWRHLDKTVLKITDAAVLTVPDDPAYAFIGADPGSEVHVVPQTQTPGVAWLGWNTQDPVVMSTIDRGVSLGLGRVEGPGELVVYLQSGSFEAPDPLWDSRSADNEPLWVDVNTHTHANWVFTEPGVYLVEATASAELIDGSAVTDTRIMRFAVGEGTNTGDALAAVMPAAGDSDEQQDQTVMPVVDTDNTVVTLLTVAIAAVALLLIAGVVVVVVRGRNAKKRASAARARS
jgi:surface-anchored protein